MCDEGCRGCVGQYSCGQITLKVSAVVFGHSGILYCVKTFSIKPNSLIILKVLVVLFKVLVWPRLRRGTLYFSTLNL